MISRQEGKCSWCLPKVVHFNMTTAVAVYHDIARNWVELCTRDELDIPDALGKRMLSNEQQLLWSYPSASGGFKSIAFSVVSDLFRSWTSII